MLGKERHGESTASVFAPVNARQHPLSPPKLNMPLPHPTATDSAHVRSYPQPNAEQPRDQRASPQSEQWQTGPRPLGNNQYPASPPLDEGDRSSPKRKRDGSIEDGRSSGSPTSQPALTRPRMDSYAPTSGTISPPLGGETAGMEQHQRTLPPMNVIDHGRPWASRDPQQGAPLDSQYHESQAPNPAPQSNGAAKVEHPQHDMEVSSTTEITRAGVQVDVKKRKRVSSHPAHSLCMPANRPSNLLIEPRLAVALAAGGRRNVTRPSPIVRVVPDC